MADTAAIAVGWTAPAALPFGGAAPPQPQPPGVPIAAGRANMSVAATACQNVRERWSKKINTFYVEYANDSSASPGVFLSGSTLNATVVLDISDPMSIVRIMFRCEGFLSVGDKKQTLISELKILFGHESGRKCTAKKPAGQYKFPVSLYLPDNLPSTVFEGRTMHVRYVCQAVLCCRSADNDIVMERPFAVQHNDPQILEEVVHSQVPQHHRTEFAGLSAVISLNRTGFYAGDQVIVAGTITNNNRNSRKVCVGLDLIRSVAGRAEYRFLGSDRVVEKKKISRVANRRGDFAKIPRGSTQPFSVSMDLHNIEATERHRLLTMEYILHVTFVTKHGLLGEGTPKYATFAITISPNVLPTDSLQEVRSPQVAGGSDVMPRESLHQPEAVGTPAAIASDQRTPTHIFARDELQPGDMPPSYDSVVHKDIAG